jgi:hypothetical protein
VRYWQIFGPTSRQRSLVTSDGSEAAADLVSEQITAGWRRQNVLAPAIVDLDGYIADLADVATRQEIEITQAALLVEHGLQHLNLHEIATARRIVTQTMQAPCTTAGPPQ